VTASLRVKPSLRFAHIAQHLFNEKIVDLVHDYPDSLGVYPEDTCIAVQKHTGDM